jgi:hypothetical protein
MAEHTTHHDESVFSDVARSIGETVGSVAAKVHDAAVPVIKKIDRKVKSIRAKKPAKRAARAAGSAKRKVKATARTAARRVKSTARKAARKVKAAAPKRKAAKRKAPR